MRERQQRNNVCEITLPCISLLQAKLLNSLLAECLSSSDMDSLKQLDVVKVHKSAALAAEVPSNADALVLQAVRATPDFHGMHGFTFILIACCCIPHSFFFSSHSFMCTLASHSLQKQLASHSQPFKSKSTGCCLHRLTKMLSCV